MTTARAKLVDPDLTRWYYCVLRCVRRASLLGEGEFDRKQWLEARLETLAQIFAISVGGFAVLDNQVHVLARLDPDAAAGWSNDEVVRRWARIAPPRDKARQPIPVSDEWVQSQLRNKAQVAIARERLASLGWFMKSLKEPLARMANREEGTRGVFFEGRFKSVAILDDEAMLTACVYIDLAPVIAGLATTASSPKHTSIRLRRAHAAAQRRAASRTGTDHDGHRTPTEVPPPDGEESLWLCPIEDRREQGSTREGMIAGFTLANYLTLADNSARWLRAGNAPISRDLTTVLAHLGTDPERWRSHLLKLSEGRLLGRFFAASRQRLRDVADQLGRHHLPNLGGCPAD